MSEEKKTELPELELLEAELERERYKKRYRSVLRSTAFSLVVVAAVAVLIAMLLLPVLQISDDPFYQNIIIIVKSDDVTCLIS